jgi:peptide deformylase
MKKTVLVDTGPLYAATDPDDQYHARAQQELQLLEQRHYTIMLLYPTLLEAYTLIRYRLGWQTAYTWLREVLGGVFQAAMQLKLLQIGEPVLRQLAQPLTVEQIRDPAIQELIEWMRETMRAAPGVGLAAPQIDAALQLAVIEDQADYQQSLDPATLAERERQPVPFHVIINPRLTVVDTTPVEWFEGCLSVSGFTALVPRARAVRVDCLNERGEAVVLDASGWYARILQHEIDHLQGALYLDRMRVRSFMTAENYGRYWADKPVAEVLAGLS